MVLGFTDQGLLPAGVHDAKWSEVEELGTNARRQQLLVALRDACLALGSAGCSALYLDGSFVTTKEFPNDYDACWDWRGVDPALLDPILTDFSTAGRAAMRGKYLGDLFIATQTEGASGLTFLDFFGQTRDGTPKGIVLINPQEVP